MASSIQGARDQTEPEYGEVGQPARVPSMPAPKIHNAGSPEEAKERLKDLTVRLENELDSAIRLFAFAREALENEMLSGMGYKQMALGEKEAKKLKEFATGLNSLVNTKIQYDKAKKSLALSMTPQEEMAAVIEYIMALSNEDKNALRDKLNDRGVFKWKS